MEIQRMNAWLPWRPEARISPVVRLVFQRGTQLGSRFFSSIGAFAVMVSLVLWFQPGLRVALAARLVPFLTAAATSGPEVSRLFSSPFGSPRLPTARPNADTDPLAQATGDKVSDSDTNAGNAVLPAFFSAGVMGSLLPSAQSSGLPLAKLASTQGQIVMDARDNHILASTREQMQVASYIAHRYRVAQEPIVNLVNTVFQTGHDVGIDPLLLLSVIAIESSFNPYAESGMGAQGLMQVMSKIHSDKFSDFGGTRAALEPLANIKVGAMVLKDCITRGGSLTTGLRLYNGSTSADDGGYGAKVLAERARMNDALRGRKVLVNQQTAMTSAVKPAVSQAAHLATGSAKAASTASDARNDA
jgi:hypothetical protein